MTTTTTLWGFVTDLLWVVFGPATHAPDYRTFDEHGRMVRLFGAPVRFH